MTQDYYGTKRITAWPEWEKPSDPDEAIRTGYGVKYEDGYTSWSPKAVFEAAYQPITAMSFGHALAALKQGETVLRAGWNGKDMWLGLVTPDENSKMSLPYIYMRTVQGDLVPWLASQTDMLADDWAIVVEGSA